MNPVKRLNFHRIIIFTVVVLVLLLSIIISLYLRQSRRVLRESARHAIEVIDGDTFLNRDGQRVRLLGIDTPESGEPFYQAAGERLAELIADQELSLRFGSRRYDRYGRMLALVFVDTLLINACLLAEGLARTYFFPDDFSDLEMMEILCAAQCRAREVNKGIWSLPLPDRCDRYFGNEKTLRFHRPECRSLRNTDTLTLLRLTSREEFLDRCYSPCRNCRP